MGGGKKKGEKPSPLAEGEKKEDLRFVLKMVAKLVSPRDRRRRKKTRKGGNLHRVVEGEERQATSRSPKTTEIFSAETSQGGIFWKTSFFVKKGKRVLIPSARN